MGETVVVLGEITTVITQVPAPAVIRETGVGPQGPQGPPGSQALEVNFAWGDATPAVLVDVEAGQTVYSVTLVIFQPFNGIGAALSVGVAGNPEFFMAANECDPKTAGAYCVTPGYRFSAAGTLKLFIAPGAGASQGNGAAVISFQ